MTTARLPCIFRRASTASALTKAIQRLDAGNLTARQIADALHIGIDRVRQTIDRSKPAHAAALAARKERRCLKHGGPFLSDGPGHRICDDCKRLGVWRDPPVAQMMPTGESRRIARAGRAG